MIPTLCGLVAGIGLCVIGAGMLGLDVPRIGLPRKRIRVQPKLIAAAIAVGMAVLVATGWPVGAITVAAGVIAVPRLLRPAGAREVIERREALAEWIQRLAGLLTAGAGGIEDAIARSARSAPALLAEHVTTLAQRARTLGAESALRRFADDLADGEVDAVVASLILRVRDGGTGLVEVLQARAATLRQQVQAQLALEAERQRPRTQMVIILVIVAVTVLLLLLASHLLDSYTSLDGQLWLAMVAGIWAGAFWWAHHLTRPAVPSRFLIDTRGSR
jgi:tight adherence protein B